MHTNCYLHIRPRDWVLKVVGDQWRLSSLKGTAAPFRVHPSPRASLTAFFDYCVSWNKSISSLCPQPKQSGASTLCCSLDDHRGLNRLDILLLAREHAANSSVFKLPATNQLVLHTLKGTILTGSKTSLSYELGLKGWFNRKLSRKWKIIV